MKKRVRMAIFLTLLSVGNTNLMSAAPDEQQVASSKDNQLNSNNDRGFWLSEGFEGEIAKKVNLVINFEQRWGANYKLAWYQKFEAILLYDTTKHLKEAFDLKEGAWLRAILIGAGCAQIARIQRNTLDDYKWVWVTRSEIEAHLETALADWSINQRFRGEYLDYNSSHYKKFGVFRWRIAINFPCKLPFLNLTPFVNNEFFFRKNTYSKTHPNGLVGGLYENRLRVGLATPLFHKNLNAEIWWQWRPLKQTPGSHPRWNNTYQWGVAIALDS